MDGVEGKARGARAGYFLDVAGGLGLICLLGVIVVADRRAVRLLPPPPELAGNGLGDAAGEFQPIALDNLVSLTFGEKELPPVPQVPEEKAPEPVVYEELKPDDHRYVRLGFLDNGLSFGLTSVPKDGPAKQLTYSNQGDTNHTAILVDKTLHGTNGEYLVLRSRPQPDAPFKYVHAISSRGNDVVRITHVYDYVRGPASGLLDNIRATYTLENVDGKRVSHDVGMRLMIDSYIGKRDGVPFYIIGSKGGIIDRPRGFGQGYREAVPDCILALEKDELGARDNTLVQLLFDEESVERPARLEVVRWPGTPTAFQLPIRLSDSSFGTDSAIGIYYAQKPLAFGDTRSFSFVYGLGSLSSQKSNNSKLSLAISEKITAGKPFKLSALVTNSAANTRVQLRLPKGMRPAAGEDLSKPVERAGYFGKADWKIETDDSLGGEFPIEGEIVGTGITETIRVAVANPNPTVQVLDLTGEPLVGRRVRATVRVLNGRPGQRVAVKPPAGFALEPGFPDAVVLATGKETASWVFRLGAAAAGARTIEYTLDAAASASQAVAVRVPGPTILDPVADGNLASGGTFRVSVHTLFGRGGRTVELKLPDGLALKSGEAAKREVPAQPRGVVSWLVVADAGLRGPVQVGAQLDGEAARAARFEIVEPKPRLALRRPGTEGERVGRAFWLAADGVNLPEGARAVLKLPAGFGLVGGKPAEAAFERRDGFVRAAWLVSGSAAPAGGSAAFEVTAAGVSARLDVPVRRDSMMGQ